MQYPCRTVLIVSTSDGNTRIRYFTDEWDVSKNKTKIYAQPAGVASNDNWTPFVDTGSSFNNNIWTEISKPFVPCEGSSQIILTYPKTCWIGYRCEDFDLDLPGIPSLDINSYVDTLCNWASTAKVPIQTTKADIKRYIDQPTYKKNTLSGISFDVVNEGVIEKFDFSNFDRYPLKGQMRDIVFLESMQASILKWESDKITSLKEGDAFVDIFNRAVEIYEQYQLYTGKKGFLDVTTNPILNTLLGAGNQYRSAWILHTNITI